MDVEDLEIPVSNHAEDKNFSHEDGNRPKIPEATHQFDPKLSSREMRKIKYYEDMFAKMANENKSGSLDATNTQYTATTLPKPRNKLSERRRNSEHKMDDSSINISGFRHDSMDSLYATTTAKSSRRSMYKKSLTSIDLEYSGSKYLNDTSSADYHYTDGKTLLDNKRLIRVQSMPMVTKKQKATPSYEEKQEEPQSASARRPRVSRWDVRSTFSTPTTDYSPPVEPQLQEHQPVADQHSEEEVTRDDVSDDFVEDMVIDPKEDETLPIEHQQEGSVEDRTNTLSDSDHTEAYLDNDARDLPLDVDDFLNEDLKDGADSLDLGLKADLDYEQKEDEYDDEHKSEIEHRLKQEFVDDIVETIPVEFDTKLEEQPIHIPVKKKSNRGRKAKKKPELVPAELVEEVPKQRFEEDFTPMGSQPEFTEESKHPPRRTKSQRTRRKRQDYYEERVLNKPKSAPRGSKTASRSHSASYEKAEKTHVAPGKREPADPVEEKFINVENLRMITLEEAEKMLNMCTRENTEYEEAKKYIDTLMISKLEKESHVKEKNPFLLDPSNIVAPAMVYSQQTPQVTVPENPLHISFKYRLFQSLTKV